MRTDHSTSSNIQITGWFMDRTTVLQQLAKLIFTFKPLWEGLPIALLEAMALKKPIIHNIIGQRRCSLPNRFYLLKYKNFILILTI
jgi:glycosyltransferase involved in cell wall biosynthesis